ncbi:uncharacterized protein LOC106181339 [Lingula anatina]|uniref:Uncharacterized protein LOC106181339 n=1 Tax=Lingula anatina TaxID=7574 RepID=A0A1S3KEU1_LINAN|nr:uncharacterized protein LOC106181339 [Lingula anatina]|eukprot:XP_013421150.1 uncharacterized protein LOC106181339 [Lingula anatina]
MTAAFTNPVADLQQYDPRYKVEVLLNESMLTNFKRGNAVDPTIEVTALCAQLDFLCLKEMELQDRRGTTNEKKPLSRTPSGQISNAFETKVSIMWKETISKEETLRHLNNFSMQIIIVTK